MFARAKAFMGLGKPKAQHSLDNLKYLAGILVKNQTVTDNNKDLLIETMRSITEILIWGDQNDSSVFDYFLEKQMITYFLHFMRQKLGRYICTQLLQTLNILFENIGNETSLYYLLSNNHVNNIILNKFDFVEEEVMAYYVSFLKTLSFKMNSHSIHFFFNERALEFPIYVEAIKFFDHPESFVRIYVRQITLNIYKVPSQQMFNFIETKTAVPYFSNLIWFIRNHVLDLDSSLKSVTSNANDINRSYLTDIIDEFIDHLNYLQDIFELNQDLYSSGLKRILHAQIMKRFLVPLCINGALQPLVAIFSLCQFLIIIKYKPIIQAIYELIFAKDEISLKNLKHYEISNSKPESLTECLMRNFTDYNSGAHLNSLNLDVLDDQQNLKTDQNLSTKQILSQSLSHYRDFINFTDDEKLMSSQTEEKASEPTYGIIIQSLFNHLKVQDQDQTCLLVVCFFSTVFNNSTYTIDRFQKDFNLNKDMEIFVEGLIGKLVTVMSHTTELDNKIRFVTFILASRLVKKLIEENREVIKCDEYIQNIAKIEQRTKLNLRSFYKNEESFLDIFEAEYEKSTLSSLNIESLLRDSSTLLPPVKTPLSGLDLHKRLPCGDMEKFLYSLKIYFLIRDLSLVIRQQSESQLPLTKQYSFAQENDSLDLNTSDLIACTVITEERKDRRFLVIDPMQFILVEPEIQRFGWGIVKFSDLIQNLDVIADREDSKSIHITISRPNAKDYDQLDMKLQAKFTFDDNIRCMSAKQHLIRARERVRKNKLESISRLLDESDERHNLCLTLNDIHVVNNISSMTSPVSPTWQKSSNNFKKKSPKQE